MIINSSVLKGERMEYIEEAHLIIYDGIIGGVGEGYERSGIDMKGCLAVPALINAHTHVGDSFAKEAACGLSVSEAVGRSGLKWRLHEQASEQSVLAGMMESISFMSHTGTFAFADFREHGSGGVALLKKALEGSSMKALILGRDLPIEECDGLGLNTHQLDQIPEEREGRIIAVHAGEAKDDVGKAIEANPDIIVHFTNANRGDMKKAAKKNIGIVACPRSNAYLKAGVPPLREMLDAGLNVALGTDNVMINSPNMWREMEYTFKQGCLQGGLSPEEVLRMATVNAAKMFGLESGAIRKGCGASMLFLDMQSENLRNCRNVASVVVNRTEPENIRRVMIEGVFVR